MVSSIMEKNKKLIVKILSALLLSVGLSLFTAFFVTGHFWRLYEWKYNWEMLRTGMAINRAMLILPIVFVVVLCMLFSVKQVFDFLFKNRWYIGIAVLLYLTVNQFHGSSISYYNKEIQVDCVDESSEPFVGEYRSIRSDEFIVSSPGVLSASFGEDAYGKYNKILRGTNTPNITMGVYGGLATLGCAPWKLAFLILPLEYAYSFYWYFLLIFTFLFTLEMLYIMTDKKRMISVMGAVLVTGSSFYMWWGYPGVFACAPGTIVCLYYFLKTNNLKKRFLFGIGTAICFSNFVVNFYPAWQVPMGYMYLAIGIWLLHENWEHIKAMKSKDWAVFAVCIAFMLSLIASYFIESSEYLQAITNTVYPGSRRESGGMTLNKLFEYVIAPFFAYRDMGNASEHGVFLNLFPIPTLLAIYLWMREKKKDWLLTGILLAEIPTIIFTTVGMPEILAKLTLYSNCPPWRAVDILGYVQVILMVIVLARYDVKKKIPVVISVIVAAATTGFTIRTVQKYFPEYLYRYEIIMMTIIVLILCICLLCGYSTIARRIMFGITVILSLVTSVMVHPISKGLGAIYDKPVSQKIQSIMSENQDAKWITLGKAPVLSSFAVANGAPTINSVNFYPNLELWEKLDKDGKYDEIYNRYAHVNVVFTKEDTYFDLIQDDFIQLHLSYKDMSLTGVDYILSVDPIEVLEQNEYVEFQEIYSEDGIAIFKVIYK